MKFGVMTYLSVGDRTLMLLRNKRENDFHYDKFVPSRRKFLDS